MIWTSSGDPCAICCTRQNKVPNYLSKFGVLEGLRVFASIERPVAQKSDKGHSAVVLPGFAAPIKLRRTVADHTAAWICLVAEQYRIDRFPQKDRLQATYERMLREGRQPLIVDAGANIGMSALWYAKTYPKAKVFAIEPDRDNFQLLVENTRAYEGRIIPFCGGVWPHCTHLTIENPESGAQRFRTRETSSGSAHAVTAITMDEILAQTGTEEIFIAKIDIEGGQDRLFAENTAWVGKTHLIVLELDDWQFPWTGNSRSFFSCVSRYPFEYLIDGENVFLFRDMEAQAESR